MEQLAANAERSSIKYKQVEYMGDHLGEEYEGMISGVTEWGLYVELDDNKCEGLVPMRELADDFYDFDEKNYCLRGRRRGIVFRLGDKVRIRVARADLDKRQLDFVIVDPRMVVADHDDMGVKVSVAQALAGKKSKAGKSAKKAAPGSRSAAKAERKAARSEALAAEQARKMSRHEKAKAAARASAKEKAKSSKSAPAEGKRGAKKTVKRASKRR